MNCHIKKNAALIGIVLILILLISIYFTERQMSTVNISAKAALYQNGEKIRELSTDKPETIRIGDELSWNEIEVSSEGIRVVNASCPDKICMNVSWKGKGSLPIVCLPNHMVITLCQEEDEEIDVLTY